MMYVRVNVCVIIMRTSFFLRLRAETIDISESVKANMRSGWDPIKILNKCAVHIDGYITHSAMVCFKK